MAHNLCIHITLGYYIIQQIILFQTGWSYQNFIIIFLHPASQSLKKVYPSYEPLQLVFGALQK